MPLSQPFHLESPAPTETEHSESDTGVLVVPEIDEPGTGGTNYRVILYNDEWHGFEEVIEQVAKATGYSLEKAMTITLEAHEKGRVVCYRGNREKCHGVTKVLREIRLQCEVDCD